MNREMELLSWIQDWFCSNCNGDWEHNQNFTIETLDNPGWSVFINLEETIMERKPFSRIYLERDENDWVYCTVENKVFKSACGPRNLIEVLSIFKQWCDSTTSSMNQFA